MSSARPAARAPSNQAQLNPACTGATDSSSIRRNIAGHRSRDGSASAWTGGGTDYGGCAGRHQAFLQDADQSVALPSKDEKLRLAFVPGVDVANDTYIVQGDVSGPNATCVADKGLGIFGQVNRGVGFASIKDGTSNTLMTGEMQRIENKTASGGFDASSGPVFSHDGWAIGGSSTLFTTGCPYPVDSKTYPLMNNGYFPSPGSDHAGGANYGLGDGSVRFIKNTVNARTFHRLGNRADGELVSADEY